MPSQANHRATPLPDDSMTSTSSSLDDRLLTAGEQQIANACNRSDDRARAANHALILALRGSLDVPAFTEAARQVIARHRRLNHRIVAANGQLHWDAHTIDATVFTVIDCEGRSADECEARFIDETQSWMQQVRIAGSHALFAMRLYLLDADNAIVALLSHELIAGQAALGTVAIDLADHYRLVVEQNDAVLRVDAIPMAVMPTVNDSIAYWVAQPGHGIIGTRLSSPDHAVTASQATANAGNCQLESLTASRIDLPLGESTLRKLSALASAEHLDLYGLLVTGAAILAARLSQQSDIRIACSAPADPFALQSTGQRMAVPFVIDLNESSVDLATSVSAKLNDAFTHRIDDPKALEQAARIVRPGIHIDEPGGLPSNSFIH